MELVSNQQLTYLCVSMEFVVGTRADLKPMQLHWAPHLRGPRAMVFGQIIHFARYTLRLRIQ